MCIPLFVLMIDFARFWRTFDDGNNANQVCEQKKSFKFRILSLRAFYSLCATYTQPSSYNQPTPDSAEILLLWLVRTLAFSLLLLSTSLFSTCFYCRETNTTRWMTQTGRFSHKERAIVKCNCPFQLSAQVRLASVRRRTMRVP